MSNKKKSAYIKLLMLLNCLD